MSEFLRNISYNDVVPNTNQKVNHRLNWYLTKFWNSQEHQDIIQKQEIERLWLRDRMKQNILQESKEWLDKELLVIEAKKNIYEKIWVNENMEINSSFENFLKWVVDELLISNYELAIDVINSNWKIIIDMLQSIASWEWIKNIAEWLKDTIVNLFAWNTYEKWKSAVQVWLIWLTATAWVKIAKFWAKQLRSFHSSKEMLPLNPNIKATIRDTEWKLNSIVPKQTFNFEEMLIKDIAKLSDKDRIEAGKFYLKWKQLTMQQEKAIIDAHNVWFPKENWKYTIAELRAKYNILQQVWFNKDEIRTLMEKWVCWKFDNLEFLKWLEIKDLYERYPILSEYGEILWPNMEVRVIWEGTKWLILDVNNGKNVLKLPLDLEAKWKLKLELEKISKFEKTILIWKEKEYIPDWFKIPEVNTKDINWKLIYSMEKVDGYSLTTLSYIEKYSKKMQEAGLDFRKMSDFEIKESLVHLWVNRLDLDLMNIDYDVLLKKYFPKKVEWFQFSLEYLKAKWLIHTDLHSWNVMVWKNGDIYIIDFDAVKIQK